jgi:hypothetical protein
VTSGFAQSLDAVTAGTWVLTDGTTVIQRSFSIDPASFLPKQQSDEYQFTEIPNWIQIITVGGESRVYARNSGDACASATGCTYKGHFVKKLSRENVALPGRSGGAIRVSGTLKGTFTDQDGNVSHGVYARLSFETSPATDPDSYRVLPCTQGTLTIELQPWNGNPQFQWAKSLQ